MFSSSNGSKKLAQQVSFNFLLLLKKAKLTFHVGDGSGWLVQSLPSILKKKHHILCF